MPKIYGKIQLKGNILVCKACGRSWKANETEIQEIQAGHKISCLYCRAMNEIRVGQVIPRNHNYMLCSTVNVKDIDDLRGDNYQQQKVKVIHDRCRRTFDINLMDLRTGDIECKYCKQAEKKVIDNKNLGTSIKQNNTINKLRETIIKAESLIDGGSIDKLDFRKSLASIKGKEIQGVKLIDIDIEKNTYITQCIKCGLAQERDLNELKKNKVKGLRCNRCEGEAVNLIDLRKRYIGNVYNGLRVERIYLNEKGATVCDVICIQGKKGINLRSYVSLVYNKGNNLSGMAYKELDDLHIQTGLALGDVINKRVYCPICGETRIKDIPKYNTYLVCNNSDEYKKRGIDVRINFETLTLNKFYTNKDNSLCDYCNIKEKCKHKSDIRNKFRVISSLLDIQDNLVYSLLDIQAKYPRILDISKTSSNIDIRPEKELIILGNSYIGRDNKVYRNCKCMRHGKELILNDEEIDNFSHQECNNTYMRFFNIENTQIK